MTSPREKELPGRAACKWRLWEEENLIRSHPLQKIDVDYGSPDTSSWLALFHPRQKKWEVQSAKGLEIWMKVSRNAAACLNLNALFFLKKSANGPRMCNVHYFMRKCSSLFSGGRRCQVFARMHNFDTPQESGQFLSSRVKWRLMWTFFPSLR